MEQDERLFFECFAEATEQVIKSACSLASACGQPFIKGTAPQPPFDVAGFIGVVSPLVKGSVALCFPKPVYLKMISNMFMENFTEITHENEDGAAEVLNMIFGRAKKVLNEKKYAIQMAIPTVFRGGEVQSGYAKIHTVQVLPFKTEAGDFYLEFLLHTRTKEEAAASAANTGDSTPESEAAFFKPFVDAMIKAFKVQYSLDIKPLKPFYKKDAKDYSFDIAGIVGITSKTINGSFMVNFKKEVYLALMSGLLGETYTEFHPDLDDGVSEIVNIVFGMAKVPLNEQGQGVHMAIPTTVRGTCVVSSASLKRPTVVIPFLSELGEFNVEISIES